MVINRVAPFSFGKIMGTLYTILGLVIGCLFALASMAGSMFSEQAHAGSLGAVFGVGAIIFFPLLYGVMGFVVSLIGAALYNLAAGIVGGIEIDVK